MGLCSIYTMWYGIHETVNANYNLLCYVNSCYFNLYLILMLYSTKFLNIYCKLKYIRSIKVLFFFSLMCC